MTDINDFINQAYNNITNLEKQLVTLDELKIKITKQSDFNKELPDMFQDKFNEVAKLSKDFVGSLNKTTETYIIGNNELFIKRIQEINKAITDFNKEIDRLKATDLEAEFQRLQVEFITQTKEDLKEELAKLDKGSKALNTENEKLSKEVNRIETVDLEAHFNKHQKTLGEIFNATNAINLTLSNLTQSLTSISSSISELANYTGKNHKETLEKIEGFGNKTEEQFKELDNEIKGFVKSTKEQFSKVETSFENQKKEINTNKIIGIVIIVLLVINIILSIVM